MTVAAQQGALWGEERSGEEKRGENRRGKEGYNIIAVQSWSTNLMKPSERNTA